MVDQVGNRSNVSGTASSEAMAFAKNNLNGSQLTAALEEYNSRGAIGLVDIRLGSGGYELSGSVSQDITLWAVSPSGEVRVIHYDEFGSGGHGRREPRMREIQTVLEPGTWLVGATDGAIRSILDQEQMEKLGMSIRDADLSCRIFGRIKNGEIPQSELYEALISALQPLMSVCFYRPPQEAKIRQLLESLDPKISADDCGMVVVYLDSQEIKRGS